MKKAEEQAKQPSWVDLGSVETTMQYYLPPAIFQEVSLSPCNPSLPSLPFSNTAKYEDEEMYVGDNKADKLKEDRIHRKAVWKEKAWQREEGSDTISELDDKVSGHVKQRYKSPMLILTKMIKSLKQI